MRPLALKNTILVNRLWEINNVRFPSLIAELCRPLDLIEYAPLICTNLRETVSQKPENPETSKLQQGD